MTFVPSGLVRKLVLLCVVLCSMIAFAAEPTTSTELDMHEGRAHGAVLASQHPVARAVDGVGAAPLVPTALAALAATLVVLSRSRRVHAHHGAHTSAVLRRAGMARRGPPARA